MSKNNFHVLLLNCDREETKWSIMKKKSQKKNSGLFLGIGKSCLIVSNALGDSPRTGLA